MIWNLKEKYYGAQEYFDGPDEDLYMYTYDLYHYPYLITLIDEILGGNYWDNMFAYDESKEITVRKKLEDFKKQVIEEDKLTEIDAVKHLKELIISLKINENQVSSEPYYEMLNNLVRLKLIDSISVWGSRKSKKIF